jgi:Ca2+-transporting ATPase
MDNRKQIKASEQATGHGPVGLSGGSESTPVMGLTQQEAIELLRVHGKNQIEKQPGKSPWAMIIEQLKSPMVLLLAVAVVLSIVFDEWLDAVAILVVIVINTVIGFYMEFQAQRSMEALQKMAHVLVKVFRDDRLVEIDSAEVVPGDVLFIEAGDMVTADGQVQQSTQLQIDEAALTGESVPVDKWPGELPVDTPLAEQTNRIFKGTFVTKGNGRARVTATGMQTELGKIARLVNSAQQAATPLEEKLEAFTRRLIKITVGLVVLIFVVGLLGGRNWAEMLTTSIALAVAAIPEGLPIVATLALAHGMVYMARRQVLVRKLSAVETLGGTTVICTDKTGTLTENKLEVTALQTPAGEWRETPTTLDVGNVIPQSGLETMIRIAVLCNTAEVAAQAGVWREIGDPLETALLKFALRQGIEPEALRRAEPKIDELPFSSETKIMATWHGGLEKPVLFAKGAAEEILKRCSHISRGQNETSLSTDELAHWLAQAKNMAASGLRVIAGAYKIYPDGRPESTVRDLVFAGFFGLIDPPRRSVPAALAECRHAGIEVIMVTGDHPATAAAIGRQLGMFGEAQEIPLLVGQEMATYEQLTEKQKTTWAATRLFARVSPQQKLDLVQVLQEGGAVVGMTGDGVNDAPALKKADIGIAMGLRGTQVAKEVADMVLLDDSFTSIVTAIREGRVIYDNIRKFVVYLLSCNLSELFVIATVSLLFLHFQLQPLQILYINLVTDVLPALALGVTPGSAAVMQRRPRGQGEALVDRARWRRIILYATVISAMTIAAVYYSHYYIHGIADFIPARCNNILFFTLIFSQLAHVFNMGSLDTGFFRTEVARNKYVWFAVAICSAMVLVIYYVSPLRAALSVVPMAPADWAVSVGAALLGTAVIRVCKHFDYFRS